MEACEKMHLIHRLIEAFKDKPKAYHIELPIGNQLSDGDRAIIYGWPDLQVNYVDDEKD